MNPVPALRLFIVLSAVLLALGLGCSHPAQPEAAPATAAAIPTSDTPGTRATVPTSDAPGLAAASGGDATTPTSPPASISPATIPNDLTTRSPRTYDSNATMYRIWAGFGHSSNETLEALADARMARDKSQVPIILESLIFFRLDTAREAIDTASAITDQDFGFGSRDWGQWIGSRRDEYAPPSEYPAWKINLLSQIDPAIGDLLEPAIERSRVDLSEVLWGGVQVDGIPPLENPPHVAPDEASYLLPQDRVFGVSINGENRAYPLRIMNAHELANDVLGGEPISLVY